MDVRPWARARLARAAAAAAVLCVGVGVVARAAAAEGGPDAGGPAPEPPAAVRGPSACPMPDAVWAELGTLMPRERLSSRVAAASAGGPIELFDLGASYRVLAAGRAREYRDEARDCTDRARVAAVFIALAIDPAEVSAARAPPAAEVAAGPAPAPSPSPSGPARPPAARLDVGAAVDAGLTGSGSVTHAGGGLRLTVGAGSLALAVGALALAPVDTDVGGVALRQWRLPADAGLHARLLGRRFEPYAELGLAVTVVRERALELATAATRTTLELGARGALGVRFGDPARLAPFVALHGQVVPSPTSIFALPRGDAGRTPYMWLGATAGMSVGLF